MGVVMLFVLVVVTARCPIIYSMQGVRSESEGTNQKFIEGEIGLTGPWQQQGAQHNSQESRGQYYIPEDFTGCGIWLLFEPTQFQQNRRQTTNEPLFVVAFKTSDERSPQFQEASPF